MIVTLAIKPQKTFVFFTKVGMQFSNAAQLAAQCALFATTAYTTAGGVGWSPIIIQKTDGTFCCMLETEERLKG